MNTIKETYTGAGYESGHALVPGSRLLSGQYEIMRYLSSGGFGITYLAKDSLNRTVVIKECFPEAFCARDDRTVRARTQNYVEDFRSTVQLFIREAHALSRLDHPSVVGVHQVFEDNETAYMALDLVDGNDLLDIIETRAPVMSPRMVQDLTLKLLDAIAHVHSQDLLHRDISPDNILVDKTGHPVLIDFGAAREEASRKSRVLSSVLVVKDGYSPQEFYVAGSKQAPCSDLYALAATLVHLITGEAPPNSQARLAALAGDARDLYVPLTGRIGGYEDAFLCAIDKAMSIVPSDRIQSAEQWTLLIDETKRIELARSRAQKDKTIDQTVMNLVKSSSVQEAQTSATGPKAPESCTDHKKSTTAEAVLSHTQETQSETGVKLPEIIEAVSETEKTLSEAQPVCEKETPYLRVTSRALAEAEEKKKQAKAPFIVASRRMSRFATVPVVFCAYLFYGHTLLQYEQVQAATVQPLLALGEDWELWPNLDRGGIVVRRGTGS